MDLNVSALAGTADPLADSLLIGGGSNDPRLVRVPCDRPGEATILVDLAAEQIRAGIYAIAVSPRRSFVAMGTAPRGGLPSVVRLYPLRRLVQAATPAFGASMPTRVRPQQVLENAGVTALLVGDDGLVLVGCADGVVRRLQAAAQEGQEMTVAGVPLPLHDGPVLALAWISADRFASLGADGRLHVCSVAGVRGPTVGPVPPMPREYGALAAIAIAGATAFFGDGQGGVHGLETNTGKTRAFAVHDGPVLAVAWHLDLGRLVTGGVSDRRLCLVDPDTGSIVLQADAGAPLLGAVPVTDGRVASIDVRGEIALWTTDGALRKVDRLGQRSVRSWVGPDVHAVANARRSAAAREIARYRDEARAAVRAGDGERARASIAALRSAGRAGEAFILEAALARREARLLDELRVWQHIEAHAPDVFGPAERYLAADNLAALLCPYDAALRFRELGTYRDAAPRADELARHPLAVAPSEAVPVRGDFQQPHQILEELDKCTLLGRAFSGTVVIQARKFAAEMKTLVSLDALAGRLRDHLAEPPNNLVVQASTQYLFTGSGGRDVRWVGVRSSAADPGGHVEVALEPPGAGDALTCCGYVLFCVEAPGHAVSPLDWNRRVANAWATSFESSELKEWADQTFKKITPHLLALDREQSSKQTGQRTPGSRRTRA